MRAAAPIPEPGPPPRIDDAAAPTPVPERGSSPKRIWVSGGAGFIGRAVVRTLIENGYEVTAPVRDPRRATFLTDLGATVVEDDLSDVARLTESLREVDALIHAAGRYRLGVTKPERGAIWDANIGTTTRVLDAGEAAGTPRIVYVSTVNVFGNTHRRIADEAYRRDLGEGFLSWYDQTKYGAHEVALQRIAAGAPIVVVQPSQVYGPGDYTEAGDQLRLAYRGKLPYRALGEVGLGLVHVDDLAGGIVAALERGRIGESYILSGPRTTLGEAIGTAARLGGKKLPRLSLPTGLLRRLAPLGPLLGRPNLAEVVRASADVTYWATSAKAETALGFTPRSIEDGLRDTFESPPDSF
jgi:nucleoside-diphosphate-sugar epimerase